MEIRKLDGPHEGRSIMVDGDGDPITCRLMTRESSASSARVKCALVAAVPVPVEMVRALVAEGDAEVPEELAAALDDDSVVITPMPLPFCSAQQPSDSQGVTIEFRLEMN